MRRWLLVVVVAWTWGRPWDCARLRGGRLVWGRCPVVVHHLPGGWTWLIWK